MKIFSRYTLRIEINYILKIVGSFAYKYNFFSKFLLQHSFLDLEHMPSEESHAKALSLVDQAVKLDNESNLEAGIVIRYISFFYYLRHQLFGISKKYFPLSFFS